MSKKSDGRVKNHIKETKLENVLSCLAESIVKLDVGVKGKEMT